MVIKVFLNCCNRWTVTFQKKQVFVENFKSFSAALKIILMQECRIDQRLAGWAV